MSAFSRMLKEIAAWFEDIGESILDGIKPLARQIARNGGALLLEAATAAVIAAEAQGGSGRDKFDAARGSVIATLEAKSLPIVMNAIHGAIEIAVAALKEKQR